MDQLIVLLLACVVAFARGGRLIKIQRFNFLSFLFIALALEALAIMFRAPAPYLASLAYVFIIAFLGFNVATPEFRIVLVGAFLNALVIWSNHGQMPVFHFEGKSLPGYPPYYHYNEYWHQLLSRNTIFPFLSDIIYVPFPVPTLISCGDVFIFTGIALLLQRLFGVPVKLAKLAGVNK